MEGCGSDEWNQKLTVEVSTPEGLKIASSVIAVSWWKNEWFKDGAPYQSSIAGETAVVDLGGGRHLFALLQGAQDLAPKTWEGEVRENGDAAL